MTRVFVGNLDSRVSERELQDEFRVYGVLCSVWVARRPPGYAFVEFDDHRDALDAVRKMDGKNGWRVELSHNSRGGGRGGGRRGGGDECYECGEPGHFARECRLRIGPSGTGSGRRRSPSPPRYRRSPSYGRRSYSPGGRRSPRRPSVSRLSPRHGRSYSRSRSPYRPHNSPRANGSPSPRGKRSPLHRSASPHRSRSYSRSPRHSRDSPFANGSAVKRDRQQSQSLSRSPT